MRLRVFALEKQRKKRNKISKTTPNNTGQKKDQRRSRNICPSLPRVKRPQNYGFDAHKSSFHSPALTLTKHAK